MPEILRAFAVLTALLAVAAVVVAAALASGQAPYSAKQECSTWCQPESPRA